MVNECKEKEKGRGRRTEGKVKRTEEKRRRRKTEGGEMEQKEDGREGGRKRV